LKGTVSSLVAIAETPNLHSLFIEPAFKDKLKALLPDVAPFEEAMSSRGGFLMSVCRQLCPLLAVGNLKLQSIGQQLLVDFLHEVTDLAAMSPDSSEAALPRMMYDGNPEILEKVKSKAIEVRQVIVSMALAEIQCVVQPVEWLKPLLVGLMTHRNSGKDSDDGPCRVGGFLRTPDADSREFSVQNSNMQHGNTCSEFL